MQEKADETISVSFSTVALPISILQDLLNSTPSMPAYYLKVMGKTELPIVHILPSPCVLLLPKDWTFMSVNSVWMVGIVAKLQHTSKALE